MTWADLKDIAAVVSPVGTILLAIALAYLRGHFVTRKEHEAVVLKQAEMKERLDRGDARFTQLGERIATLPTRQDMHELALAVTAMGGDLKAVTASMTGLRDITERIEAAVARHESIFAEGGRR